jgi:hypothetical protein
MPREDDDHDHDVADEADNEDAEVGHEQQQHHPGGHYQRLLYVITAAEADILIYFRLGFEGFSFLSGLA